MKFLAQQSIPLGNIGGEGLGPFGKVSSSLAQSGATGLQKITSAVSAAIGILTIAAAIWFFFQFIIGGFSWITAGGDKGKLTEARDRITNAFIGLIIVVAGWSILALTGKVLGLDTLISSPSTFIQNLGL